MDIPVPFQFAMKSLLADSCLEDAYWSPGSSRHFIFEIRHEPTSARYIYKMAKAKRIDKDDLFVAHNFRRPFWLWGILEFWKSSMGKTLPFVIPRPYSTNVDNAVPGNVLWLMMEHMPHRLICPTLPAKERMDLPEKLKFNKLCHAMADSHHAMQQITLASVQEFISSKQLPDFLPHQSLGLMHLLCVKACRALPFTYLPLSWLVRGIEKRKRRHILRHPGQYVIDIGSFERKNFLFPPFGTDSDVVCGISDVEFATWSRPHTALAKAYIRLWANDQRPDLARQLLRTYVEKYIPPEEQEQFFRVFAQRLLPKTYSGTFFDIVDRKIRDRFDLSRVLRRQLRRIMQEKAWYELIRSE